MVKDKKDKGITLVALIITIIIMAILLTVGLEEGTRLLDKAKIEDKKTEMLLIQAKAKIIIDKKNFGDEYQSQGMLELDINNNSTGHSIQPGLQAKLQEVINSDANTNFYIWDELALTNNSLREIKTDDEKFYIIDYNTGEVYYSLGYEGKYSLTEIQGIN